MFDKVGFSILLAMLCSIAQAQQLVPIKWGDSSAGELIVSSQDKPVRKTDAQLKAEGYKQWTYTDGTVYWFKPVMHCDSGMQTVSNSQMTLHSGSS